MASLDLLDFQMALDVELQKAGLPPGLRRSALKEARRVVEAMAFRFAILDERALPEDLDYLRALEAMQPAPRAAAVLARRRPVYAKARRRRLATTWLTLAIVALGITAIVYYGTSEVADTLALVSENNPTETTVAHYRNFTVGSNVTRLHVDGTILLSKATKGVIEVFLIDPSNGTRVYESYASGGDIYLRQNVYAPQPGVWTLVVDFNEAQGSARVELTGVRDAR